MNGSPIASVSSSYPPTKPRLGSCRASSRMTPAIVVPRHILTGSSKIA